MRRRSRRTGAGSPREDGTRIRRYRARKFRLYFRCARPAPSSPASARSAMSSIISPFRPTAAGWRRQLCRRRSESDRYADLADVAADQAYGDDSYGAAFGPDGRLYTVAYDGKLRQYGPGPAFKNERESQRAARRPYSVAVDPRGQLLAVGFADSTQRRYLRRGDVEVPLRRRH